MGRARYRLPGAKESIAILLMLPLMALQWYLLQNVLNSSFQMFWVSLVGAVLAHLLIPLRWDFGSVFWVGCTGYTFVGMAVYEYREAVYFNFVGDYSVPYSVWVIVTVAIGLARFLGDFRMRFVEVNDFKKINQTVLVGLLLLGVFSVFVLFREGVPIFADDLNSARAAVVENNKGVFWYFYMGLQLVCAVLLCRVVVEKSAGVERVKDSVIIAVLTGLLALYGGRFFVFFPYLLCVLYLWRVGRISGKFLVSGMCGFIVLSIGVSVSRFLWVESDYGDSVAFVAFRNDFFPESRTLIQMNGLINEFDADYFFSPFVSFMPSVFYDIIGLDKKDLLLSIGKYLNSFDPSGEDVGYRVSFTGEAFLAFGYGGVFVVAFLVSVVSILFNWILPRDLFSRVYVLLYGFLLVPYGVTFVRSSLIMIPFGLLIIRALSVRVKGRKELAADS